ncbi:membrane protein DedA with SNARE-associated domain [Agromyces hippuratus]|uniref:Membrane protein DedA with SNARE-associated domain n=1 Tax=Agromyces hippuratus TaxID=286438 RepID=A0A852X6U9_9MICO|nr:VTT domain-containing protein [Agromyces hippuratus]NYG21681.1 membrane protein DedA with SNARE-associated domain [Agromyces hippuratus]
MDVLNDFILHAAASPWLLLIMFATAVIDGFFPPIPSEMVLVAAAAVAASAADPATVLLLCLVAAIGATIGDNIAYAIGSAVGTTRFRWMRGPRVSAAFVRAQRALVHRGTPVILGARYIPVGRVVVNMSAGALHYPWRRFLPISAVAGVTWAVYSACIGILAGQWLEGKPLLSAVIGVVFALVIGLVIDRVAAARRRRADAAAASPSSVSRRYAGETGEPDASMLTKPIAAK